MAVRIRLKRLGRTHRPYYRVVATDTRRPRSGESCEVIGIYDPLLPEKNLQVDIEKAHAWVRAGARYSEGVETLLKHNGYEVYPADVLEARVKQKAKVKAKRQGRKKQEATAKGTYVAPSRRARNQHQAKLKAARMAELNAEAEKRAKAKADEEAKAAEAEAKAAEAENAEAPAEESSES